MTVVKNLAPIPPPRKLTIVEDVAPFSCDWRDIKSLCNYEPNWLPSEMSRGARLAGRM